MAFKQPILNCHGSLHFESREKCENEKINFMESTLLWISKEKKMVCPEKKFPIRWNVKEKFVVNCLEKIVKLLKLVLKRKKRSFFSQKLTRKSIITYI